MTKILKIVWADCITYERMLLTRRDGRRNPLTRIGTETIDMLRWPAWMIVSRV